MAISLILKLALMGLYLKIMYAIAKSIELENFMCTLLLIFLLSI